MRSVEKVTRPFTLVFRDCVLEQRPRLPGCDRHEDLEAANRDRVALGVLHLDHGRGREWRR